MSDKKAAQPRGDPTFARIRGLIAQLPDHEYRKGMVELIDHLEVRRELAVSAGSLTEVRKVDFILIDEERRLLQELREHRRNANENRRANLRLVLQIVPTIIVFLTTYL